MVYTAKDIDDWTDMFARRYETAEFTKADRVQSCGKVEIVDYKSLPGTERKSKAKV